MPPIIDDQTDELEARRLRREARQAPPAANGSTPPGGQSAGAARDLLRGLITDGTRRDGEGGSATTHPGGDDEPAASASRDGDNRLASECAPMGRGEGEKIDELIRRVKESTAGADAETSSTLQQRRPKGTADLSRDAAMNRAAARRRAPELRGTKVSPTPKKHRRIVAMTVLLAGIAILLATLAGTGGTSAPRGVDSSTPSSPFAKARAGVFGGALDATIAGIAPELRAVARHAAASARAASTRHEAKRRPIRPRARRARSRHRAAVVQSAAVTASAPPPTTVPETQTYAPAPATGSTASQTSATSQPSAKSSSRPAGPTGSDPLGGIGSCVKGC
jgi:hypothetical protein